MYKVLIVDDDIPMMKYLAKLVDWSELGIEVVGMANSGKKALQLYHTYHPDFVVTDIGMPQMDGLALVKELKALQPHIRIIFLTCHEEFHYARQAIKLNADDYLIKDELTKEQFQESLNKIKLVLTETKEQLKQLAIRQDLQKHKEILIAQFFQNMTTQACSISIMEEGKRLGYDWKHANFLMAIGYINEATVPARYKISDYELLLYGIRNIAEELIVLNFQVNCFSDQDGYFICILNYPSNLTVNTQEQFALYGHRLVDAIKQYLHLDTSLLFSDVMKEVSQIGPTYRELKQRNVFAYYEDSDLKNVSKLGETTWFNTPVLSSIDPIWSSLIEALKLKEEINLKLAIERLKEMVYSKRWVPQEWKMINSQWLRMAEHEAGQVSDGEFHQHLLNSKRLDETIQIISNKMFSLLAVKHEAIKDRQTKLQQIDDYISKHLSESISLSDMAESLYLNPSYLSRIFKQETGMNFTDYIHYYKMRIACQQLKMRQYNIADIGLQLGYLERTYFSKVFKKYIGVSPKDYH